jgi:PHD/YefM family antitoxin component YafN of YafNO toxin-antitoxin module
MAYRISASDIKNEEALDRIRAKERVLLQSHGKTIGVIISAKEFKMLEKLREEEIERLEDEEDRKAVLKARRDLKSGKTTTIPLENLLKKYGME